ncbi:pyridine nucleotide-disulfide oxidoreductase [Erythrobacteraceae bacterium CFH 75059]|uniref:FAD-dependent oxidoreductase n=1 Tax=Qipengyuania thermophila TaxID=2509361 RepID=UPI0010227DBB|nr:FAD-dependent oxidoreductase [Qipengyuania thermophila]TCD05363.1 pyridine nucleotide-disulfide oxidoreductase [Erythrobacteraceae bacterium CFH 75059]
MHHLAIVGAGPAGFYTAEAAARRWNDAVQIDIIDALPAPFGLIRSGVAPDHQSIKAVARRYAQTAASPPVRFVGNVRVGLDVTLAELLELYDAVVLATGAPEDRPLGLPGEDLPNVFGSAAFVGWYNGHPAHAALKPDLSGRHAVVVGMGNVALDVARVLAKTPEEFAGADIVAHALDTLSASAISRITILGRRGPHQIAMTPKELGELLHLARASPHVDAADLPPAEDDAALEPGRRKSVALLRQFAREDGPGKPVRIAFDLFAAPVAFRGDTRVRQVEVERTRLEGDRAVGTGARYRVPADLVVTCTGYRSTALEGAPFDHQAGRFVNEGGRVAPGLYCVGWARRGPTGTIGTNRPDGEEVVERLETDGWRAGGARRGREGLDALVDARGIDAVTFDDWLRIDAAEVAAARPGAPREKFVSVAAMLQARTLLKEKTPRPPP